MNVVTLGRDLPPAMHAIDQQAVSILEVMTICGVAMRTAVQLLAAFVSTWVPGMLPAAISAHRSSRNQDSAPTPRNPEEFKPIGSKVNAVIPFVQRCIDDKI